MTEFWIILLGGVLATAVTLTLSFLCPRSERRARERSNAEWLAKVHEWNRTDPR